MSIECYYGTCSHHSNHHGGEGPFCDEPECKASDLERKGYALERRGYNLEELEQDNPHNQWVYE